MLKMALLDCAITEKCYSVDGGRGICRLFPSPPRGIWQLKNPCPRTYVPVPNQTHNITYFWYTFKTDLLY